MKKTFLAKSEAEKVKMVEALQAERDKLKTDLKDSEEKLENVKLDRDDLISALKEAEKEHNLVKTGSKDSEAPIKGVTTIHDVKRAKDEQAKEDEKLRAKKSKK